MYNTHNRLNSINTTPNSTFKSNKKVPYKLKIRIIGILSRLQEMEALTMSGKPMYDKRYNFDFMGNFFSIKNIETMRIYGIAGKRIASRLAGPSAAFVEEEDLDGPHVEALGAL